MATQKTQAELPLNDPAPVAPAATGPIIEYVGEGADKVKFTINPKATRYVVNANGLVKEDL